MDHFLNPRNVGELENPDGVGEVGNPVCGDMMTITIKVENDRIEDLKFKTFGCGAAIAVSSMLTEMAKGKTLDDAMKISNKMVAEKLGGLPSQKMHCSNLGADALHRAIEDYLAKKSGVERVKEEKPAEDKAAEFECPFCRRMIDEKGKPFCTNCSLPFRLCSQCGYPVSQDASSCTKCGAELEPIDKGGKPEDA